ncbi:sodium ion-translocating decarboxylase subunit beta [Dysosmobacter sp.]|jgi:sodium ion-translocating decarboxylase beta subunit|uniref:sodium ion-translocating decarboxylase subunit beta n=2 Tax=Dysosmobacter sp. TaxID=2591382 RepID=UPI002A816E90|nr:sodium ion-translocating decarboxylase subunit beta [Dysosmobacter sp.]MCI7214981.1 sodium ion-translocating decarboxylase subunit beta [Dysosmobacter sp.]MDY3654095.1 sodium ion-translocating decarboxylase subunit beta [Dysosmobacter sp.]
MDAIIRFLQDTGFYLFSQDGNWRCLIMLGIACVLLYLGIVKKFEPLLLVPIAFGMLITNLPGANMFHEIFFAGGHIHWDLIGGQPVTASLLADLHSQGVAENVLAPYIQQLMTAAQTTFSPEMVEQAIAAVTEEAGAAITALEAQLQALVQAEQAAAYYGMTLSGITITPGLVDILYLGVKLGIYPCLIFMGVGAMTDFGPLIANPKSLLLGAAAQLGIFITFVGCRLMGFTGPESSAIGIIGGADGPTAIFVTVLLAPALLGPIAVAAYSYMALVPVIQPPIMKLLTTEKERQIVMKPLREVSKKEKIIFPIVVTIFVALLVPSAAPLIACLMLGNLFKECGVTERLSKTVQNELINIVTIFLGVSVGATATGTTFLSLQTIKIMAMGVVAFSFGTAGGVLLAKFMNLFLKEKINPLIGSAGVSAVPMAARVSQMVGQKYNPGNFLLMHAMGPNVAGVIGSAIAAGVLISLYG